MLLSELEENGVKQFLVSQNFLQTVVEESEKNNESASRLVADLSEDQRAGRRLPTNGASRNVWSIWR